MDSVRENFSANECKTTVVKRIGTSKEQQQDNKLVNKIKSSILFKSLLPIEDKGKIVKSERAKPKGPPPPPPPSQPISQDSNTNQNFTCSIYDDGDNENAVDIPKTGFDFLDNW